MGNFITSAKRYTFDAEFTVAGVISVIAEDEDSARELIQGGVGMIITGSNIYSPYVDEIAWDFDGRPELKLLDEVT